MALDHGTWRIFARRCIKSWVLSDTINHLDRLPKVSAYRSLLSKKGVTPDQQYHCGHGKRQFIHGYSSCGRRRHETQSRRCLNQLSCQSAPETQPCSLLKSRSIGFGCGSASVRLPGAVGFVTKRIASCSRDGMTTLPDMSSTSLVYFRPVTGALGRRRSAGTRQMVSASRGSRINLPLM